jgi:hypothetical protein
MVVREIWRPELDVVRQTYGPDADPDGGPLNSPDAPWAVSVRAWSSRVFGRGAAAKPVEAGEPPADPEPAKL